jgi:hypothetical protein
MTYASTGSEAARAKAAGVVATLARAQAAWTLKGEAGYLFTWSPDSFARLEAGPGGNCKPVCVPFYVVHKVMAGLLDQYQLASSDQACARGWMPSRLPNSRFKSRYRFPSM